MKPIKKTPAVDGVFNVAVLSLCRSRIYELLAAGFFYPDDELLTALRDSSFIGELKEAFTALPETAQLMDGASELETMLRGLFSARSDEDFKAHYTHLFGQGGMVQCPSYETEYGLENVFMKAQELADVAGFYRSSGLEVSRASGERPDHISAELEFMCFWTFKEFQARKQGQDDKVGICLEMERKFVQDHLGRWMGIFSELLAKNDRSGFYAQLGHLVDLFLSWEASKLGVSPCKVSRPPVVGYKPDSETAICGADPNMGKLV